MSTFQLTIVTPDGEYYHGPAESLTVRATTGELPLLPRHIDFVTALGLGEARVTTDGQKPVSYTPLTLPTKRERYTSVGCDSLYTKNT